MFTPNRAAFYIGGMPVYWYGILIAVGVFCGILVGMRNAKRRGISPDAIIDVSLIVIPLALVFARLYYVAFSWEEYAGDLMRVFSIREGGMAIYGGVIGGALGVYIASKWKRIKFLDFADMIVAGLALGQAIGRWGNFLNQEAYGVAIANPSWQFFPFSVLIEQTNTWHAATFFYESVFCLLLSAALFIYGSKPRSRGMATVWYVIGYGMERAIVEALRTDSLWIGHLRVSQILSLILVIGGLVYLAVRGRRSSGYIALGYGALWGLLSLLGVDLFGNATIDLILAAAFIVLGLAVIAFVRDKSGEDEELDEALRIFKSPRMVDSLVVEELIIDDDELLDDLPKAPKDGAGASASVAWRPELVDDDGEKGVANLDIGSKELVIDLLQGRERREAEDEPGEVADDADPGEADTAMQAFGAGNEDEEAADDSANDTSDDTGAEAAETALPQEGEKNREDEEEEVGGS